MRVVTLGLALAALATVPLSAQAPTETPRPATPAVDDAMIFATLERANTHEIELGELAARMGQSSEVRDLGKKIADDHTKVRQKARDLAARIGVTPGTPMDPMKGMKDSSLARLQGLKGNEFDAAFVGRMVEAHQRMLDEVTNKLIPAAKNTELKQFLTEMKPDLQSHLDQARALEKKLALGN